RVPAIVVGNHGDSAVAKFSFAREFGFGDVGHADDVESELTVHVGFGKRGELRAFHTDVSALVMDGDAAAFTCVREGTRGVRTSRLVEGNVGDEAVAEEGGDAVLRAIDELIGNKKLSRRKVFLK